jgi:3-isopropylmalate/(R)-2-methylmalate dehydratase small subunit
MPREVGAVRADLICGLDRSESCVHHNGRERRVFDALFPAAWHQLDGNPPGMTVFGDEAMEKFTVVEGVAAPLRAINVDTDAIIPKQYLKTIKRTGLGRGLFSEKRYRDDGSENPDFVLNKPAYRNAKILVAGDNFGCGSSREHAPWALQDFGITCVISTSFGDIFYNNCFKNGVLPIQVSPEDLEKLFDDAERGANARLTVDLEKQEIRGPDGGTIRFDIDPHRKHCMLNGLDDIGLTLVKQDKIASFEEKAKAVRPWA